MTMNSEFGISRNLFYVHLRYCLFPQNLRYQIKMSNCQKLALSYSSCSFLQLLLQFPIVPVLQDCISTYFQMSLFGADFLRNASRLLYVHGKNTPDVQVIICQRKDSLVITIRIFICISLACRLKLLSFDHLIIRNSFYNQTRVMMSFIVISNIQCKSSVHFYIIDFFLLRELSF